MTLLDLPPFLTLPLHQSINQSAQNKGLYEEPSTVVRRRSLALNTRYYEVGVKRFWALPFDSITIINLR